MSAQHTPSPWRIFPGDLASVYSDDGTVLIVSPGDPENCIDGEDVPPQEEAEANARLIAAAPELLTQLVGAVALAEHIIASLDIDPDTTTLQVRANGEHVADIPISTLLANQKAAIAKAEGRS